MTSVACSPFGLPTPIEMPSDSSSFTLDTQFSSSLDGRDFYDSIEEAMAMSAIYQQRYQQNTNLNSPLSTIPHMTAVGLGVSTNDSQSTDQTNYLQEAVKSSTTSNINPTDMSNQFNDLHQQERFLGINQFQQSHHEPISPTPNTPISLRHPYSRSYQEEYYSPSISGSEFRAFSMTPPLTPKINYGSPISPGTPKKSGKSPRTSSSIKRKHAPKDINTKATYSKWTSEEDELLRSAVQLHGPNKWSLIATHLPNRTPMQCSTRWLGALNPTIHKGRWTEMEDQLLRHAVEEHEAIGERDANGDLIPVPWNKVASTIPNRTGIQCQARWSEALDPCVRKGKWSPDEDILLYEGVHQHGRCWIKIADQIPGRTQRQCRTRWMQIKSKQEKLAEKSSVVSITSSGFLSPTSLPVPPSSASSTTSDHSSSSAISTPSSLHEHDFSFPGAGQFRAYKW